MSEAASRLIISGISGVMFKIRERISSLRFGIPSIPKGVHPVNSSKIRIPTVHQSAAYRKLFSIIPHIFDFRPKLMVFAIIWKFYIIK